MPGELTPGPLPVGPGTIYSMSRLVFEIDLAPAPELVQVAERGLTAGADARVGSFSLSTPAYLP
ncbi:hypothetical protein BA895_19980 [Humibacillus sp. DSM 29435]|nr:hypothetical protein BA895_19980 [Humibacillus sp. DSM 29435]